MRTFLLGALTGVGLFVGLGGVASADPGYDTGVVIEINGEPVVVPSAFANWSRGVPFAPDQVPASGGGSGVGELPADFVPIPLLFGCPPWMADQVNCLPPAPEA